MAHHRQLDTLSPSPAPEPSSHPARRASPREIVKRLGLAQISDVSALGTYCDEAIAANPRSVEDYRAGKTNAINALKGFVMKKSQGKANPLQVDEILKAKLSA